MLLANITTNYDLIAEIYYFSKLKKIKNNFLDYNLYRIGAYLHFHIVPF